MYEPQKAPTNQDKRRTFKKGIKINEYTDLHYVFLKKRFEKYSIYLMPITSHIAPTIS